jgi:hypothetical protein
MAGLIPTVKVAYDEDLPGIRCPYGKISSHHTIHGHRMSSKLLVKPIMRPLIEEKEVVIGQHAYVGAYQLGIYLVP